MANVSWNVSGTGVWTNKADWSTGAVPTSADNVTIAGSATETIVISGGTVAAANNITITDAKATLAVSGTLDLTSGMAISAGKVVLNNGATISGGTITEASSGALVLSGGTLANVTVDGTLDLSANNASATLSGNDVFNNAAGTGAGIINLTGYNAALNISSTTTLNSATLDIGDVSYYSFLYINDPNSATTLTLGSSFNVVQTGYGVYLEDYYGSSTLINNGTISAGVSGGQFRISNFAQVTNGGNIIVTNSDNLTIDTASFANSGNVTVGAGGYLTISGGSFGNAGHINVSSGGQFTLEGNIATAQLSGINVSSGGVLDLYGGLNNSGATLLVGSGTSLTTVELQGTISGGVISAGSGSLLLSGGTLANVTVDGTLDLSANNASATLSGNDVFNNAAGTGAGIINLTGYNAALNISSTTTLNSATLDIGDVSYYSFLYINDPNSATTLTLGSSFNVVQTGYGVYLEDYYGSSTLINNGTISAGVSGGQFRISNFAQVTNGGNIIVTNSDNLTISNGKFTNNGSLTASSSGTFNLSGGITNLSAGTLTGGSYEADAGGTIAITAKSGIVVDYATITLSGNGSLIEVYNATSNSYAKIDNTLTTIGSGGTLNLLGGRSFLTALAFTDNGTINLGGGTLKEGSITIGATGKIAGYGTVTGAISASSGSVIEATGGTLTLSSAITGSGTLQIDGGATLELASTAAETVTYAGVATLKLDNPGGFTGSIANLAAGDAIILAGAAGATSAVISGGKLVITLANGSTLSYAISGSSSGLSLKIANDASGKNAVVTVYGAAAASTATPSSVSFGNVHVGTTLAQAITIANTAATGGYSENLDGSATAQGTGVTTSGSFSGLAAGSASSAINVGASTASAGVVSGAVTISLASDGAGVDGNGATALASQTVNVSATVYAYASASVASSVSLGNTHVHSAVSADISITNSASNASYTESLDASFTGSTGGVVTSGANTISAGGTDSTDLLVAVAPTSAGVISGTATLGFYSDGTAINDGLGQTTLASQTVSVTGAAYDYASASLASTTINLGVVHVGATVSAALSLTDSSSNAAYTEGLDASLSTSSASVTTLGSITNLAAGQTDSSSLLVGVNTSASGNVSGTATVSLASDGSIDGLASTALGSQTVTVTATVDNYAQAAVQDSSGYKITGSSGNYTLNLGTVVQGSSALSVTLGALNAATGLADLLGGTITTSGGSGFTNSGFGSFSNLGAGQSESAQVVSLSTTTAGSFSETITISASGSNSSGYAGSTQTITLTITGTVTASGYSYYNLTLAPQTIVGANGGGDIFTATAGTLNSRDQLTGGNGANSLILSGGGVFDINAPKVFANIPTISATEGQAVSGVAGTGTSQIVLLRDGANETLNVAAGTAAKGNTAAQSITIYGSTGTNSINLASGADVVYLGTGTETVTLGGTKNSVYGGGGTAVVNSTVANATAIVAGESTGSTSLNLSNAGTVTLNAADTYLTVKLQAGSTLSLNKMGFVTADGSAGTDKITAGAAGQTLIGGSGDTLTGYSGYGDIFSGASTALNGDAIKAFGGSDIIDLTNVASGTVKITWKGTATAGTLTVTDGTHSAAMTLGGGSGYSQSAFTAASDGHGGTSISFV